MKHLLVTGGAGFIGGHAAHHFLDRGWKVTVFDNLARIGSDVTLEWLRSHPAQDRFHFVQGDVRDFDAVAPLVAQADAVLHAAGQTAVTTSVVDPRDDFEINALGTFNVLEGLRLSKRPDHNPVLLYTSTNKVYGGMEDTGVVLRDNHYGYADLPHGVPESQPLDFHSPYGCSKGSADQYVRDYARIYGLNTTVFRQSCIYGTWQFGTEDQGWLAHFTIAAVLDLPLTIYGDGMQVRDALYITDLVAAFEAAFDHPQIVAGQVFNMGGGPHRSISLLDLIDQLNTLRGRPMQVRYADWRPGDQRVFIADTRKAHQQLGWTAQVSVQDGVRRLYDWVAANRDTITSVRTRVK